MFGCLRQGQNTTTAALQAQYAAWRPVYTAKLRVALGPEALLVANAPAPAVADPSLNGITIEFEHCSGDQRPHDTTEGTTVGDVVGPPRLNEVCRQTLLGQKMLTDMGGHTPVFGLWLTHSEIISADMQCEEMDAVRRVLPWVREGDDLRDCTEERGPASCVYCNTSSTWSANTGSEEIKI